MIKKIKFHFYFCSPSKFQIAPEQYDAFSDVNNSITGKISFTFKSLFIGRWFLEKVFQNFVFLFSCLDKYLLLRFIGPGHMADITTLCLPYSLASDFT